MATAPKTTSSSQTCGQVCRICRSEWAGARRVVEIPGASHALPVSQPQAAVEVILEAAAAPVAA